MPNGRSVWKNIYILEFSPSINGGIFHIRFFCPRILVITKQEKTRAFFKIFGFTPQKVKKLYIPQQKNRGWGPGNPSRELYYIKTI